MPEPFFHIFLIGFPILVLLYCAACAAALRPRTGTLAWIAACDRPVPPLLGQPYPVVRNDILPLAAVFVLSCLLRAAGFMLPFAVFFSQPPARLAVSLLEQAGAPFAAVLSYLSMKRLFGQTYSAALCAALAAADLAVDPVYLFFSAAALFFLVRYLTVPEDANFRQTAIPLVCGFLALAAGCSLEPALLMLLPAAIFLCVLGCADRFTIAGKLWLSSCLAAALLTVTLTWIAVFLPAGLSEGYSFPSMLVEGRYYWMILQRLGAGFSALYQAGISPLRDNWPLLAAAFPALIAAVIWLVRDQNRRSMVVLIWSLLHLLALVLLGQSAISLACALCFCMVWSKLEENRFLWLACAGAGVLLALLLTLYFLF